MDFPVEIVRKRLGSKMRREVETCFKMVTMPYDLHVVRTPGWLDAAEFPITREEVEGLLQSDGELAWSASDYVDSTEAGITTRNYMITWKGLPCFLWERDQITCASPDQQQTAKLIDIASRLNALVIGDDGERYE